MPEIVFDILVVVLIAMCLFLFFFILLAIALKKEPDLDQQIARNKYEQIMGRYKDK